MLKCFDLVSQPMAPCQNNIQSHGLRWDVAQVAIKTELEAAGFTVLREKQTTLTDTWEWS